VGVWQGTGLAEIARTPVSGRADTGRVAISTSGLGPPLVRV
jgi:hypothetical protein